MNIIRKLWHVSPASLYRAILKRTYYGNDYNYSTKAILNDKKHLNANYLVDRWERYNRILIKNKIINPLKIKDKTIFELGCGPLLGWGPILLYLGAKKFYIDEPNFNKQIIYSKEIQMKYFRVLYDEMVSNYGKLMEFKKFIDLIKLNHEEIDYRQLEKVDIILSNSVLEHISKEEIKTTLQRIKYISTDETINIHCVDHTPHNEITNNLMEFYKYPIERKYHALNLLRRCDYIEILNEINIKKVSDFIYRSQNISMNKVHKSWTCYNKTDLEAKVVFYVY